jgi:hypothetical protein
MMERSEVKQRIANFTSEGSIVTGAFGRKGEA